MFVKDGDDTFITGRVLRDVYMTNMSTEHQLLRMVSNNFTTWECMENKID